MMKIKRKFWNKQDGSLFTEMYSVLLNMDFGSNLPVVVKFILYPYFCWWWALSHRLDIVIYHFHQSICVDNTWIQCKLPFGSFLALEFKLILFRLAVFYGTGVELLCMTGMSIVLAMLGMLSPASRGSLITAAILLFVFFGYVSPQTFLIFISVFTNFDLCPALTTHQLL